MISFPKIHSKPLGLYATQKGAVPQAATMN